jgi:hypothetical protein
MAQQLLLRVSAPLSMLKPAHSFRRPLDVQLPLI